jgi:hypothetical protein
MKNNLLLISILIACGTSIFAQVPSYVPTNGLIGWWPFTGNANDLSGNGNNGVLMTGPAGTCVYSSDRFNIANSALLYSGNPSWNAFGSYILVQNSPSLNFTGAYTINVWINIASNISVGEIINKGPDNTGYFISRVVNWQFSFGTFNGGLSDPSLLSPNTWYMLTMVRDNNGNGSLFLNGNLMATGFVAAPPNNNYDVWFGLHQYGSNGSMYPYQGKLDDIGFWNRTLSVCEVAQLYSGQVSTLNLNAGSDLNVCSGDQISLSATGATNYSWDNGVVQNVPFIPTNSGVYTVTGTDAAGCTGSDQVSITINSLPTVFAGNDIVVCEGTSVTLNGSGAASYSWDNSIIDGTAFNALSSATYTVIGTDVNNCSNSDQVVVTVNALPSISAGADQSVCEGTSVTLSGTGGVSYAWDNNVTDGTSFIPVHLGDLTYTVTGTDGNNCTNTDEVVVTVNEQTTATQTQTSLDSYTWPVNNQTYTQSGTYTTVIPNAAGCDSTITLDLTLSFTGIEEQENSKIIISPNPASDYFMVSASEELIGESYSIIDLNGKTLKEGTLTQKEQKIEIGNLSEGMYLFKINNETEQTFRIVKN